MKVNSKGPAMNMNNGNVRTARFSSTLINTQTLNLSFANLLNDAIERGRLATSGSNTEPHKGK